MLKEGFLTQAYPATAPRLSEGVFWFFIAATILLALLDAHLPAPSPKLFPVAWSGVFALYYVLRFPLTRSLQHPASQVGRQLRLSDSRAWRRWRGAAVPALLLDLLVITGLVVLSGGEESPLYLLYLGWSVALLDISSPLTSLWMSVLVCLAFLLEVLLTPHQPFSALQIMALAQQALLLVIVLLGINAVKVSIRHMQCALEAERRQWEALRQAVFLQLSHELYTPLSAINASATLLVGSERVTEQKDDLLRVIARNCARMNILVDDLLALWREPQRQFSYAPQILHCLMVAQSVGKMLGPLLEENQQHLVIAAVPQDVCVLADRQRLEQVLVNLLGNAHKYAPDGTAITLTISGQEHDVLFAVHDEGAGVPLEEQRHLFDVFYRGTNSLASSRGSGVGLALAKTLVVLQGGCIWVESLPGSGCTLYFLLPCADSGASADAYFAS